MTHWQDPNNSPIVLVVEDHEDNRFLLRYLLAARGYRVVEAEDGLEAVKAARNSRPDLILMDLTLPRLDGISAMLRIREEERFRATPIVAVSGHARVEDQAKALDAGFDGYVTKPFDFDQLDSVINRLLPTYSHAA